MTCGSCGAENREGARFCDSCGAALAAAPPAREQRKVVTVLFCDVAGSTALGERLDPEALREVMGAYFEVARAAIERHGGTLEKFIGDAVMAVFGVPTVREDDALRAVRAAEELRDAVEIDVRIGVNTGEVVTGTADKLVTGDAVNVAARLEQAAETGEILIGDATYRLVRGAVDVELLPPLAAKGKTEPLTAYRLRAVTGDVAVARRQDAPLVGRERERRLLADAWERSCSENACSLFTILGTPGVGKSRLTAEFLTGLDSTVAQGRCLPYGDGITYWPVVEVVKQLLGGDTPTGAVAALLGEGQAPADDIAVAVRRLLEERAAERPLAVLFDDLQWGEPTFLDLVEHVADWSRDAPILLLCLARPELLELRPGWGGGKMNATTVLLEPLSAAETDELIDELLSGGSLDAGLRERIRAAAEGNPLFVEQMLAMVEESPGDVTVPSTIQALLAARLDQLPAEERAALERGAVEGQIFHGSAVAALAPDDPDVATRLKGLVRKELVRPSRAMLPGDDAFRFRHLLIRDAAYDALPKAERAALHERFAVWLEEHAPTLVELDEVVGYHLEQAARYGEELGRPSATLRERAALRLAAAGLRAGERHDPNACMTLLSRASALFEDDPGRLKLLPTLGQALYWLGRFDEAYAVLDEAAERADPDTAAYAFFFRTFIRGHGESISHFEMERDIRARLELVESVASERTLASGYLSLAWVHYWAGRLALATEAGERSIELAQRAGDQRIEYEAFRMTGLAKTHGEVPWSEVERFADEMDSAGAFSGLVRGWTATMLGRFDEADRLYETDVRELLERGQVLNALLHHLWYGIECRFWAGDLRGAEEVLREGWDGLGELGEAGYRSTIGGSLAEVIARQGRLDEADALLDEAIAIGSPDDWVTVSQVDLGRALVASRRGNHELALVLARKAVELVDAHEYLTLQQAFRLAHGEILIAAGALDEARVEIHRARDVAARKGSTVVIAQADELLAGLAQ
jgi:class 3 adenylate cyclase